MDLWRHQVDEARNLVYFVGLRETPLERHLYAAPLSPPRPHAVTLLTTVGHSCTVDIDEVRTVIDDGCSPRAPVLKLHEFCNRTGMHDRRYHEIERKHRADDESVSYSARQRTPLTLAGDIDGPLC